jgi:hypothetical protein
MTQFLPLQPLTHAPVDALHGPLHHDGHAHRAAPDEERTHEPWLQPPLTLHGRSVPRPVTEVKLS